MTQRRLSVVLIVLLSFGFIWGGPNHAEAVPPIRIMPAGDSITYDHNSDDEYSGNPRPIGLRTGYRQPLWIKLTQAGGYAVDFVGSVIAGQDAVPPFDPDNEGHPGWRGEDIADNIYGWLHDHPADIVLLHIGTNDLNQNQGTSAADVQEILDEIDRYEDNYGVSITVFLARIINTSNHICPNGSLTTTFNNNVAAMALGRANDKIVMVDMECGAGLDYALDMTGPPYDHDMYDNLHPNPSGYAKMADKWYSALAAYLGAAKQSSITIVTATQPSGGSGFNFSGDLGAFTLADGQSQPFTGLEARNYKITESLPLGWSLQGVSCNAPNFTLNSDGVTIHLDKAQNITCTFTNLQPAVIPSGTYLEAGSGSPLYFSFSGGSFSGTKLDAMIDGLVLNNSTTGLYTSQVFDAGGVVKWKNIEWVENVGELPNDSLTDKSIDMSGNVLLFHLNKDAAQGETNSVVHDFSGRGHTGAASGTGVSIGAADSGKFKGGYAANNIADGGHIEVPSSADFNFATSNTDGFSFFTWFSKSGECRAPDNNNNESIASRFGTADAVNTWWFGCGGDAAYGYLNKLVLEFYPTNQGDWVTLVSPTPINDGNWHHGGWVYDPAASQIRLYLDGVLVDLASSTPDPFFSAKALCIGAYGAICNSYEFAGKLDEVAVFKRALTSSEVKKLFTRGVAGLDLQARACDDPACSGESWIEIADESPQPLSLTGRYLQYKFNFSSPDTTHSPELYSVTIHLPSADIDGDGVVDGNDLYLFMLSYGKSSGTQGFDDRCDFDGNQTVNATDLATFTAKFGK